MRNGKDIVHKLKRVSNFLKLALDLFVTNFIQTITPEILNQF